MEIAKKKSKFSVNKSLSMNEQLIFFNNISSFTINQQEEYAQQQSKKDEQPTRQIGIFEQFKQKYDQLRKENQQKRQQIDQLQRLNKRLQIKLLNINTEFYDRQIKRLRGQVQKYQQQSENYKFKYFQAENRRKQFQASLNVKETQLTRLIKELQVEKVKSVQQKIQQKQNEKKYLSISKNTIDKQKSEIEKLSINLLQVQQLTKAKQKQSLELKQQLSSIKNELTRTKSLLNYETNKTYEKITRFRSSKILQIENKNYKQQLDTLRKQVQEKSKLLHSVECKVNEIRSQMQRQKKQYQQRVKQVVNKKTLIEKHYQGKVMTLNRQVQTLKMKCLKLQSTLEQNLTRNKIQSLRKSQQQHNNLSNQPQNQLITIHNQLQLLISNKQQQIRSLKQNLYQNTHQINKLKQSIQDYQLQIDHFKGQITILEKKLIVNQKNLINKQQIQLLLLHGEINTLKKKLQTTQIKLQIKSKEVKQKDKFIIQSIIHQQTNNPNLNQQNQQLIIAQLQRVLENQLIQKLVIAEKTIKSLQSTNK